MRTIGLSAGARIVPGIPVWMAALGASILSAHSGNPALTYAKVTTVQSEHSVPGRATSRSSSVPPCETTGTEKIKITCNYTAAQQSASKDSNTPRIVLNHFRVSFEPHEESHMVVELSFTSEGLEPISDAFASYLVINDDAGQNHVRRVLQPVDFRKLAPGQRLTFSDRLLVGAFRPGHYTIYLCIPNTDPALKLNPAHNLLLSSFGIADSSTGLNTLASFTVVQRHR